MIKTPSISSAIIELREQLIEAMKEGDGKSIRFVPTTVEVELSLVFKSEASAGLKGGGLWSILEISGSGQVSNENTHKVKLTLQPVGPLMSVSATEHIELDPLSRVVVLK